MRKAIAVVLLFCYGCSIEGGNKKGAGWRVHWQPPEVKIQNGESRPLEIDFGYILWTEHDEPPKVTTPPANPIEKA